MRIAPLRLIVAVASIAWTVSATADVIELPLRVAPPPTTTSGVPHVQLGVTPTPEISKAFCSASKTFPGIEIRPTIVSMPGALGFWISEDIDVARPDVIVRGARNSPISTPDGSLHATLAPALAEEAVRTGWAIAHPWAALRPGWGGFVLLYTPLTPEEMEVVFQLVVAGFDFVTTGDPGEIKAIRTRSQARPTLRTQDPSQICATC